MTRKIRLQVWAALMCGGLAGQVAADAMDGNKQIFLIDKKGKAVQIGHIVFNRTGEHVTYQLHMDHQGKFKDYFLSMKEMKCLEGPELMCHLPYPYSQPRTVTAADMSWLSHDLLFMFKQPAEFGANFWNGVFYELQVDGEKIRGKARAVDLNHLASPPADLAIPPFGEAERDDIEIASRWLPYLEIR